MHKGMKHAIILFLLLCGAAAFAQSNEDDLRPKPATGPGEVIVHSKFGGQIFGFDGYAKCRNAVAMLTWHFDRIEAFAAVIASPTWNWQHPRVLKHLQDVMAIDPDEINKSIQENNVALLEFASET